MTRSPYYINLKDNARNSAEALCRHFVSLIKPSAGISDAAKIAIGVRPPNSDRDPVFCPQTVPLINVVAATPSVHTVTYADSLAPDKRAKPFGAVALQLYLYKGDAITDNETLAKFVGTYTRTPVSVEFSSDDDGLMASYFARWVGKRGDTSPFSLPVSMRIAA